MRYGYSAQMLVIAHQTAMRWNSSTHCAGLAQGHEPRKRLEIAIETSTAARSMRHVQISNLLGWKSPSRSGTCTQEHRLYTLLMVVDIAPYYCAVVPFLPPLVCQQQAQHRGSRKGPRYRQSTLRLCVEPSCRGCMLYRRQELQRRSAH